MTMLDNTTHQYQLGVREARDPQWRPIGDPMPASETTNLQWADCKTMVGDLAVLDVRIVRDFVYLLTKIRETYQGAGCGSHGLVNNAYTMLIIIHDFTNPDAAASMFDVIPYDDYSNFAARFVELPRDNGTESHGLIETNKTFYGFRFHDRIIAVASLFAKDVLFNFLSESPDRKWLVAAQPYHTKEFVKFSATDVFNQITSATAIPSQLSRVDWNKVDTEHLLIDTPFRGTLARIQAVDGKRVLAQELTGGGNDFLELMAPQLAGGGHSYLRLLQKKEGRYVETAEEYFPSFYDFLLNYSDPLKLVVGTADGGLIYYQLPP